MSRSNRMAHARCGEGEGHGHSPGGTCGLVMCPSLMVAFRVLYQTDSELKQAPDGPPASHACSHFAPMRHISGPSDVKELHGGTDLNKWVQKMSRFLDVWRLGLPGNGDAPKALEEMQRGRGVGAAQDCPSAVKQWDNAEMTASERTIMCQSDVDAEPAQQLEAPGRRGQCLPVLCDSPAQTRGSAASAR